MKKLTFGIFICCGLNIALHAQSESNRKYQNFPLILTIQFHSLSLPFRDFNFSNIGIGIGTEVGYNSKGNGVQQISAVWYRNKTVGNGILIYTQAVWRPTLSDDLYAELKAGVGYLFSFRPVESFKVENGNWVSAGRKGKNMFTLPIGISLGYDARSSETLVSSFISYQFMVLSGYNKSVPIMPEALLQAGVRLH